MKRYVKKFIREDAREHISRVKNAGLRFRREVKRNTLKAVLAAFAFVIALVWRDAIKAGVDEMVLRAGISGTGYIYQIITASIITVVCVFGIMVASRLKGKEDVKE
ncbi:hypothetical protein KY358_06550 [Candidatus Woesearchaeota archaeon]|nr:hypothetical protein [Candidatus Woesearchaeota archaeon]